MASGTIWLSSDIGTLQGKIEWSSYSNGTNANSSTVSATMYIARTDWYTTTGTWSYGFNVGGQQAFDSWYGGVTGDWVAIASITNNNVGHNNDGTGYCYIEGYVDGPSGTSMAGHGVNGKSTVTLDTIPRYANITEFRVSSTGLNSITINWNADADIDFLQYSLNGAAWANPSSGGLSFTINRLNYNTTYSIKIKIRRRDSGLWTESWLIYGTTKDIATITNAPNFNLGDTVTITKTNPSGNRNNIRIETLNPTTTIVTRNNVANNITITFTDAELDALYKKMGINNSMTVRYVVDTIGDATYYHWVDRTCTLTGNQKNGHLKLEDNWKRTKHYKKIDGAWKRCIRWKKVNGTWKRCI